MREFIDRAEADGATVLTGGHREAVQLPAPFDKGYYYPPTVVGNVTPDMHVVQEEVINYRYLMD